MLKGYLNEIGLGLDFRKYHFINLDDRECLSQTVPILPVPVFIGKLYNATVRAHFIY
jgi:hypothetical protein